MVEVELKDPSNFLKIREVLTRIGIPSGNDKVLTQSCHILHKRQKYYIVHFKEMFLLDGKESTLSQEDLARRNTVIELLEQWGLIDVLNQAEAKTPPPAHPSGLKIISHAEKKNWQLKSKYTIGKSQSRTLNESKSFTA